MKDTDPPEIIDRTGTLVLDTIKAEWTTWYDIEDGDEHTYANDDGRYLVAYDELDIRAEWYAFWVREGSQYVLFLDQMRRRTFEPDRLDEWMACVDCERPLHVDDSYHTNDGHGSVCESCYGSYWTCEHCEDSYRSTTTVGSIEVCNECLHERYSRCDDCEVWYPDGEGCGGSHRDEGCCESPAPWFSIRNDGCGPLANDTRVTVTLPAGEISSVGLCEIMSALQTHAADVWHATCAADPEAAREENRRWHQMINSLDELGPKWQAKDGNYTKRLSRHAHKKAGLKVPPALISQIGNIASNHSRAVDFDIEVTRNLNLPAGEFAHAGSCWWTEYSESRCALKTNGGFGLRTFSPDNSKVTGRAWVLPLRRNPDITPTVIPPDVTCRCRDCFTLASGAFTPTFDTTTADAFVVFNGYESLTDYTPARMLAHMVGGTYRKIAFTCEPMYINSSSGYLVGPEEIIAPFTDSGFDLYLEQHADLYEIEQTEHVEIKETVNA